MILEPARHWAWHYDSKQDRLVTDLGEQWLFVTPYSSKWLIPDARQGGCFDLDDAAFYQQALDHIRVFAQLSDAACVQIALNACAIRRFAKPTMPKSWFFAENPQGEQNSGALVSLQTAFGRGQCLVIERQDNSSLCMLIDEPLALSDSQTLHSFQMVKVMNNRLWPSKWQPDQAILRQVS